MEKIKIYSTEVSCDVSIGIEDMASNSKIYVLDDGDAEETADDLVKATIEQKCDTTKTTVLKITAEEMNNK